MVHVCPGATAQSEWALKPKVASILGRIAQEVGLKITAVHEEVSPSAHSYPRRIALEAHGVSSNLYRERDI